MRILGFIFICTLAFAGERVEHAIDEPLGGATSLYTDKILKIVQEWPAGRSFCHLEGAPSGILTLGVRTKDRPYYTGFKKCMSIKAPLAEVQNVVEDWTHYKDLSPGTAAVRLVSESGNEKVLEWERKIPVFFVPNIKYQIAYVFRNVSPDRFIVRFQFKEGTRLKFNDGVEFLESVGPQETLLSNYEFYEADYGLGLFGINAVSADNAWKENLRGSYLSLLGIRFKAEHPDWDYARVEKEALVALATIDLEKIQFER